MSRQGFLLVGTGCVGAELLWLRRSVTCAAPVTPIGRAARARTEAFVSRSLPEGAAGAGSEGPGIPRTSGAPFPVLCPVLSMRQLQPLGW